MIKLLSVLTHYVLGVREEVESYTDKVNSRIYLTHFIVIKVIILIYDRARVCLVKKSTIFVSHQSIMTSIYFVSLRLFPV